MHERKAGKHTEHESWGHTLMSEDACVCVCLSVRVVSHTTREQIRLLMSTRAVVDDAFADFLGS